jgi:hypothetical protein
VDPADRGRRRRSGSSKPFVENLSRYGLLPDPGRDDGLPVGLTVATNLFTFGMDFVGVTCAACHVGELRHDGKAVRVDGATNMFNLQLFYSEAVDALVATTSDRGKLWDALKRLGRQDWQRYGVAAPFVRPATLVYYGVNVLLHRDRLEARRELIDVIRVAQEHRDREHPTSGFGRLDAFDGTRNFLFTRLRKADAGATFEVNSANLVKLDAAVKFPPLWSRKAMPPEPVEAYRAQPGPSPSVWGFKDYAWIDWTIAKNGDGAQHHRDAGRGRYRRAGSPADLDVRQLHPGHEHARARVAGLLHRPAPLAGGGVRRDQARPGRGRSDDLPQKLRGVPRVWQ